MDSCLRNDTDHMELLQAGNDLYENRDTAAARQSTAEMTVM